MRVYGLHHWQAASLHGHSWGKLEQWFYGPCKILAHVGSIAYKLELPAGIIFMMFSMWVCQKNIVVMCQTSLLHCRLWKMVGHSSTCQCSQLEVATLSEACTVQWVGFTRDASYLEAACRLHQILSRISAQGRADCQGRERWHVVIPYQCGARIWVGSMQVWFPGGCVSFYCSSSVHVRTQDRKVQFVSGKSKIGLE